jgi:hypothetical protein
MGIGAQNFGLRGYDGEQADAREPPPPRVSFDVPVYRTLDSQPAPVYGGGR